MAYEPPCGYGRATLLTVPGLGGSGAGHWQTIWEATRDDTVRADLGMWNHPQRNPWVTKLDRAIQGVRAPVVLVAHSLGCLAVAWWAELAGQDCGWPVAGALLVAPPDVERPGVPDSVATFAPRPRLTLPFPSILVASDDDPWCRPAAARDMAHDWGSHFVELSHAGHINAESGLGAWSEGQALLCHLLGVAEGPVSTGAGIVAARAALAGVGRPRDEISNSRA